MKILLINKYFYLKGGSERYFFNLARLLESRGHEVVYFSMRDGRNRPCPQERYFIEPVDYDGPLSRRDRWRQARDLLYSREAKRKLSALIEAEKPDLAHLHNIHHQLSPSIIDALKRRSVPMVMTLHDYKMVCPVYTLFRDGRACEECRHGRYYRCFLHRCTKGSAAGSLVNTLEMYLHHRFLKVYRKVDVFVTASAFAAGKMEEMGFPAGIVRLPYFLDPEEYRPRYGADRAAFCYFGRLSGEKGLSTLLAAARGIPADFKIIGEGPLEEELRARVKRDRLDNVRFLGYRRGEELAGEIRDSLAVIVPSEWYELFGQSVTESFALGTPVIGADTGAISELIADGQTGYLFAPGDVEGLRSKIRLLLDHPARSAPMGRRGRKFVEDNFNPREHFRELLDIYRRAGLPREPGPTPPGEIRL